MKPTAVLETNFELSLKAKDQCGVKDQGGAVAKLAVTATTQRQRLCDAEDCGEAESDWIGNVRQGHLSVTRM